MRTALKLAGLPQPEFAVCADRDAAVRFARRAGFPLVVKAPASAGADKVFKCRDMAELEQRVAHVLETPSVFGDFARYALVEEFIRGEEYVVDLVGFGDGTFSVMGCWRYCNLESFLKSSIVLLDPDLPVLSPLIEMAMASAEAPGIRLGPVHCEVKNDPLRGPVLIEAGARMCGADLPRFYTYTPGNTAYELGAPAQ
jgi:biotin carboxylase